jgi:hypothetical protein
MEAGSENGAVEMAAAAESNSNSNSNNGNGNSNKNEDNKKPEETPAEDTTVSDTASEEAPSTTAEEESVPLVTPTTNTTPPPSSPNMIQEDTPAHSTALAFLPSTPTWAKIFLPLICLATVPYTCSPWVELGFVCWIAYINETKVS